jgi:hypothetical protein
MVTTIRIHFLFMLLSFAHVASAQLYSTQTGSISFYSTTPVEDIQAESKRVLAVINTEKNTIAFKVANTSFEFPNKFMQEHFNEKYMESDKYEYSTFSGTIQEKIDYTKSGIYDVTVDGKLNIHGVEQTRSIKGKINVTEDGIAIQTKFGVALIDHKIKVPTVVVAKIAEVIDVSVTTQLVKK